MTNSTASPEGTTPKSTDAPVAVSELIQTEIVDALELLDFAVASGFKTADGQTLPQDVLTTIRTTAAKSGVIDARPTDIRESSGGKGGSISATEWALFDQAYYRLAVIMRPVTAQTLRDTEATGRWINLSPAYRFSKLLWLLALGFAAFVVGSDFGLQRYGPVTDGEVDFANSVMQLVQILIPFAYGGLGSCVFLLRSAHTYIHERTFDVRRRPEYFNRIILGTIAGGAIVLFVNEITTEDESLIQLSSAALGFLAGYSTDFLFNTIERVIGAILPKVGIQTVRQAAPAARTPLEIAGGDMTLKDLVDRFDKAQGADKEIYKSLIEKLRDRI